MISHVLRAQDKKKGDNRIMKMKKLIAVMSMVGMLAVAATGCGSSDNAENKDAADANTDKAATEWDSSNDITIVSREDGSGTRGAFVELFGIEEKVDDKKVDMTTVEAQITNNTSVMLTTVAEDDYAIGYVSLGSLDEKKVNAVKIDGAEATAENIANGSYKVSRPFNVAVKKDLDNEVAKDFMNFIMSEEGQKIVEEEGYIPVADVKAYEGTKPAGDVVVGGSSSVSPVMEKLIEAYKTVNPDANIELQTSDSTTGMTSAIEGSYDIGMASRELKDEEKAQLEPTVIATDGIAVIVNKANPTEELSADQVKSIYVGDVMTWADIAE